LYLSAVLIVISYRIPAHARAAVGKPVAHICMKNLSAHRKRLQAIQISTSPKEQAM
jgi:hypothetical protein